MDTDLPASPSYSLSGVSPLRLETTHFLAESAALPRSIYG